MSENTGPVDPYREISTDDPAANGAAPHDDRAGGDAWAPADPGATHDASDEIPNEFAAPRPRGEAGGQDAGRASTYGQDASYGQSSPYGPGGAYEQQQPGAGAADGQDGYGAPQAGYGAGTGSQQHSYATGGPQQGGYQQGGYQQDGARQGASGPAPAGDWSNTPPPHLKGVFTGPISGQPASDSEAKLWAVFAQLAAILGLVISWGFLGWLGPLIIFLVYKDRNRFIRYNAAEALNAAIAVVICNFVIGIVFSIVVAIIGVLTLGIGFAAFTFLPFVVLIPGVLHVIFAIIGAVKANDRTWWNYPLNIRLVK